ncbi:HAD-IA family hydrolase [Sandaracinobacter sp. RS1-74]|uniref:HAD family hydrolase n=1 Tax=Sandaracinobacteroides sayramensis TaxID=2913411 RepID=UPI001EDB31AE|nr:HAD-IA family hydrolase [Sandaracinobacteroides sayramensis]MCG2840984.1 HAD-IA family hydrolase [Sandaracinobacteroides sayramensis]
MARLSAVVKPRAVVWDVGHVLYDWDPRFLYEKLIPDAGRLDWFLGNVVTRAWHFQHDAGRPFAETSAELIALYPQEADLIGAYGPRWLETIPGPIAGTHALVERLAEAAVPQFGITNFSGEFWDRFRPTAPLFDRFQDVVVSGHEKLMKPDPAIYALARARFGLGDGEAIFIDDNPANVAAARDAGWFAHHFTAADDLSETLRGHGFPV